MTRPQPDWFKQFIRWLRKLVGSSTERSKIKIVEQYHNGGHASVLRLQDPSIPGAVDLWRIDRHHERTKFFIVLINIAQLRQDLAATRSGTASSHDKRGLANGLWSQIASQSDILATHYWVTGWDTEFSGTDSDGRSYRSHRVHDLSLLAVDLQGASGAFAGDKYAVRFARDIIKRIAANEFREFSQHRSWIAAVKSINWVQWLEGASRGSHGISSDHTIQPRRSTQQIHKRKQ